MGLSLQPWPALHAARATTSSGCPTSPRRQQQTRLPQTSRAANTKAPSNRLDRCWKRHRATETRPDRTRHRRDQARLRPRELRRCISRRRPLRRVLPPMCPVPTHRMRVRSLDRRARRISRAAEEATALAARRGFALPPTWNPMQGSKRAAPSCLHSTQRRELPSGNSGGACSVMPLKTRTGGTRRIVSLQFAHVAKETT